MKKATLILTMLLAGALARPAHAEGWTVHANLNFPFAAADVVLPAGHYDIRSLGSPDQAVLEFTNTDTGQRRLVTYAARVAPHPDKSDALLFDTSGSQHYLTEIRLADGQGYLIPDAARESCPITTVAARLNALSAQKVG